MAPRRELFSFTKMSRFSRCSKSYEHHYVRKLYRSDTSEALIIGGMVHEALESYYLGEVNHPIEALDKLWLDWFEKSGAEGVQQQMLSLRQDVAYLFWRASADCTDPDIWIRNADGKTVPKPGGLSMNRKYKTEYEKLSIDTRKAYVERTVTGLGVWNPGLSLVDVYTTTYQIIENYQDIPGLTAVMSCEFPLSEQRKDDKGQKLFLDGDTITTVDTGVPAVTNPVILPRTGHYYTGSIDLIAEIMGQIAIIDHKTSNGDPPDVVSVAYHDQLLMYAWAYYQRFGVKPHFIGINHLRTGQVVLAEVEWDLVEDAVARFEESITAAATGVFTRKSPFEYQSPCLGGAKSITEAKRICPYLDQCYPQLVELMTNTPMEPAMTQ